MQSGSRRFVAGAALAAMFLVSTEISAEAQPASTSLEGRLTAIDGRPAVGWRLHLIDEQGVSVAGAPTDGTGSYAFTAVKPGTYALGIEDPEGRMAPVASTPLELVGGQRSRRNVKLVTASPAERQTVAGANYGLGAWWAGLSSAAKTWVVLGGVALVGVSVVALQDDDDDDDEPAGSPF